MPAASIAQGTDGIMVLKNMTMPSGGIWLANSAGGGHWWQGDSVLGVCRVDSQPAATPPWQLTNCSGTAKSGGQMVAATPGANITGLPAGARFVFVADSSSKSVSVVRFVFNPANETLSSPLIMSVPNVTQKGGGVAGGRPIGLALAPNGQDLYVGYVKSGDLAKITGATTTTSQTPPVAIVGSTSDGRGIWSLLMFNNDLYLSEVGGFGLSRIIDPSGLARAACNAAAPCTAASIFPQISSFPGGLATDNVAIYLGDAPLTTPGQILRWVPPTTANPAGALSVYSTFVPAYTSTFDNVTRHQYAGPIGLGMAPNGDLYVGDDPTFSLVAAVLPTTQGHLWRVPAAPAVLSVTSVAPNNGPLAGGTPVTITGSGFLPGATSVNFGSLVAAGVNCASTTTCTVNTPTSGVAATVDVRVVVGGQLSPITPADQFTYNAVQNPSGPFVTSIAPTTGTPGGGTLVTISGGNLISALGNPTTVNFGPTFATSVICASATSCTAVSPAGTGVVDVRVTVDAVTSAAVAADQFTYAAPTASLYAWGITAPKGGMLFVPGNLGGHFWSSDHSSGFCRQDPVPGTTLHAINFAVCDNGTIGSPGQAVYDARVNPAFNNATSGALVPAGTHFIYVPDNAVKSTAIWRLTFDPNTETILGVPEAMTPLADVRTLKPNGMALGPDGSIYVTDLTEANIRRVTGPNGDPRLQTITIVAVTGDGRGANGTIGFIGNRAYISENRAASWFDITQCPTGLGPCATTPIPLPSGAFVAGVATDPVRNFVYAADSPGGANATIWRYNVSTGITSIYLTGGQLPAAGTPNATVWCALTCTRPWDPALVPGGIAGFSFAFGIWVDPTNGSLYVTEDATAGARGGRGHAWVAPFIP